MTSPRWTDSPRNHIAALDPSGNLVAGFAPSANGNVLSVTARGDVVYFGGAFSAVDGVARSRAAEVTTDGTLQPFAPAVADNTVRAIALSPDGTKILLAGGNFTTVGGLSYNGMAAVDSTTGAVGGWAADSVVKDSGNQSAIYSLSTRGDVVYATGYVYGVGGNLEGSVAMNWSDGSIKWLEDCHGDSYSSVPFNDSLYVVSHAHDCSNVVGGWSSPGTPTQWRRAQAFSRPRSGRSSPTPRPATPTSRTSLRLSWCPGGARRSTRAPTRERIRVRGAPRPVAATSCSAASSQS